MRPTNAQFLKPKNYNMKKRSAHIQLIIDNLNARLTEKQHKKQERKASKWLNYLETKTNKKTK